MTAQELLEKAIEKCHQAGRCPEGGYGGEVESIPQMVAWYTDRAGGDGKAAFREALALEGRTADDLYPDQAKSWGLE